MELHQNRRAGARAAVPKGTVGQSSRPPSRLPQQDDAAAVLLAGEAEVLTRKAVELALIGDPWTSSPRGLKAPKHRRRDEGGYLRICRRHDRPGRGGDDCDGVGVT
jgi:hypothetical protein